MSNVVENKYYTSQIAKISNDFAINELFSVLPSSSINAYKKSLIYNADKEYSKSNLVLQHNFFMYLSENLHQSSPLRTYKKYEQEFEKMENFFYIEKKYFVELLKKISSNNSAIKFKAVEEMKNLIRDYNSKSKGHYIKMYNKDKIEKLEEICYRKQEVNNIKEISEKYDFNTFINELMVKKPYTYSTIIELMANASNIVVDDIITTVFEYINDNKPLINYLMLFGIYKPINYDPNYTKNCKITNRLHDNFEKLFNSSSNDSNYKKLLVQYINNKVSGIDNKKIEEKVLTSDKIYAEVAYSLLRKVSGTAKYKDNMINFYSPVEIDINKINRFKKYEDQLYQVEYFLNYCYKLYTSYLKKQCENKQNYNDYFSSVFFDDNSYEINAESYLHYNKMANLIYGIDLNKLHNLNNKEFDSLKKLLNNEYLLFAYLIGNIELNDILLIINNYSGIVNYLNRYDIKFNDLDNILRISKTFRYVNDLDIALIGYDNIVKIINYNQFCGLDVTDESIKSRIHKAKYLSIKSEQVNKSSLPFDIDVSIGNLKLKRYLNNDPDILVSGIETKTCFFVSVNENDFFFYSLLNKNGFVVKIVDENNNFIARAACFRRNNILMINGIRLKNNEIYPKNKEQLETMKKVVKLIEMMAEKIIYSTTADECPIDYVVCNKAGILEGNEFESKYEFVDYKIIREAINIYGEDWKEFVSINEKENDNDLLQEAPLNQNKSFTTDFGENYSLILIKSRNNMGLLKPSNISLNDQEATYERPVTLTKVYVNDEINSNVLEKINRIRALHTFNGNEESQLSKQNNFKLLNNTNDISKAIVADNWIGIVYKDDTKEFAYTTVNSNMSTEIQKYASFTSGEQHNKTKTRIPLFKKN